MRRAGCLMIMALWAAWVALMVVLFCGCSTPKVIKDNGWNELTNDLSVVKSKMDSLSVGLDAQWVKTSEAISNIKVNQVAVTYSLPDSVGRQYVIQEVRTESQREDRSTDSLGVRMDAELVRLSNKVDSLGSLLYRQNHWEREVVKVSWWGSHKDAVYSCIAMLIVGWLVFIVRRK